MHWVRVTAWVVLCWLAAAGPAWADGYKDGLDALEAGRYAAAAQHFRNAIADKPEERKRLFARTYLPHYYLGLALSELGQCRDALDAFAESERQGVVTEEADEYAELQRRRSMCQERLKAEAQLEQALAVARQAVEAAREEARAVAAQRQAPALAQRWGQGNPSLARREAQAQGRLDEAARTLEAFDPNGGDVETLRAVTEAARQAREQLTSILQAARELRGEVQETREKALSALDAAVAEARDALEASEELAPYPPSITARRREIAGLLQQRDAVTQATPLDELAALGGRLQQAADRLRNDAAGPPGQLVAAAEALFAGRFGQVLEILEDRTFPNRRANAHARLLQSAARYYLYEAGGRTDETLLEAARRDATVGRRMDAGLTLPERAFPPGFRELWESVEDAPPEEP